MLTNYSPEIVPLAVLNGFHPYKGNFYDFVKTTPQYKYLHRRREIEMRRKAAEKRRRDNARYRHNCEFLTKAFAQWEKEKQSEEA